MSNPSTSTVKRDSQGMTPEDWKRQDALTDEEITAAALADPDAQPISAEQIANYRPPALSKVVRHKLGMVRAEFAAAYGIPVETSRAWERHEIEPTPAELAYLRLIEREPELAKLAAAK